LKFQANFSLRLSKQDVPNVERGRHWKVCIQWVFK